MTGPYCSAIHSTGRPACTHGVLAGLHAFMEYVCVHSCMHGRNHCLQTDTAAGHERIQRYTRMSDVVVTWHVCCAGCSWAA